MSPTVGRLARIAGIGVLLIGLGLGRPERVVACTGEIATLASIVSTAEFIVEGEVVRVGPQRAVGVPDGFTFAVQRVLMGHPPPTIEFDWPTPIAVCDGYIAALGDRFVVAVNARPFPAGSLMHPMWPIRVQADVPGMRDDLATLLASITPLEPAESETGDATATGGDGWSIVVLVAAALGALVAAAGLGSIVSRRRV